MTKENLKNNSIKQLRAILKNKGLSKLCPYNVYNTAYINEIIDFILTNLNQQTT